MSVKFQCTGVSEYNGSGVSVYKGTMVEECEYNGTWLLILSSLLAPRGENSGISLTVLAGLPPVSYSTLCSTVSETRDYRFAVVSEFE